jgi:hypothetical protein
MPDIFVDKDTLPSKKTVQPQFKTDAAKSVYKLIHDKPKNMGLFAAYCLNPNGISFTSQEPDEIIILFLRRHFITNVPWILATLLLFLVPPLLFIGAQLFEVFPFNLPFGLVTVITGFYYLIVLSYAFSKFVSWFYNIGVVTQKRIVDIDTSNILSQDTTAANLGEVVDVKFNQRGFFQSFFNYGDIHIQTEALRANFEFTAAPKPTTISDIISDLRVVTKGEN